MDINSHLKSEIQRFILEKENTSSSELALKKNPFPEIDYKILLNQIETRAKSKTKLPTWFSTENIIYPEKVSIEQTSSELTALYKSELIFGASIIDLSGGFGVDDFYFSKTIKNVVHCEINSDLSSIVEHNFKLLNVENVSCYNGDSKSILEKLNRKFDWIYVDPSRRNETKGKVFLLKDCTPNVPELQDFYHTFSDNILIKTSPILDFTSGINELKDVSKIHIIAIENEVKELLWEIKKNTNQPIHISAVNFNKEIKEVFEFELNSNSISTFSLPKKYIYEPNSAIMKSGGFSEICSQFNLDKLHQHSHLYTSNECVNFPGRVFKIENLFPFSKKEMTLHLENKKINITTRNFPETVESIRKKWKIKEGGNEYSFFTTDSNNNKIVLICSKI